MSGVDLADAACGVARVIEPAVRLWTAGTVEAATAHVRLVKPGPPCLNSCSLSTAPTASSTQAFRGADKSSLSDPVVRPGSNTLVSRSGSETSST